jgi:hypothetical protein
VQNAALPTESELKFGDLPGGTLLRRFVAPVLEDAQAGKRASLQIVDERLKLTRLGLCETAKPILWAGQPAVIDGATIKSATGTPLFTASDKLPEKILDAVSKDGTDVVLNQTVIQLKQGKRARSFPLGGNFESGGILLGRPDLLMYYVMAAGKTQFFIRTPDRARLWFTAADDFVSARLDKYGNLVVAYKSRLLAINKQNQATELFKLKDEQIKRMEILKIDNAILLNTQNGLLKIPFTGKLYTLILGDGLLENDSSKIYWCDTVRGDRFEIAGLDSPGQLQSDKVYVRTLLSQADKFRELGLPSKALQKYLKVLEIMPSDANVQTLVRTLAQKLSGEKSNEKSQQ